MSTLSIQQNKNLSPNPENRPLSYLRQSFQRIRIKTINQPKTQLPTINTDRGPVKKQENLLSVTNRHLRYLFHEFCKQCYVGGARPTFADISHSAAIMTVNKWMTFCKQFQLTKNLSNRQAGQIFKIATQEKKQMNINQFCLALKITQERSKISPEIFASQFLHVNSHESARDRLSVMRINFSGPKTNFFVESTLTESRRVQQKKQEKIYREKKREEVLHQGMFKQHIQLAIAQRKALRKQKMQKIRNRSMVVDRVKNISGTSDTQNTDRITKQPMIFISPTRTAIRKEKIKNIMDSYSRIFQMKKSINLEEKNMLNASNLYEKKRDTQVEEDTQSKSRILYEKMKNNSKVQMLRQSQFNDPIVEFQEKWDVDSDAQSDIILKNHFENEKKIKGSNSRFREIDNDLMITKYQ